MNEHKYQDRVDEIVGIIENAVFPSDEDEDSIEHVDMGYSKFMDLINELAVMAKQ